MVTISALKDFWKLPVSRQLSSAAFLTIGVLMSVIVAQDHTAAKLQDQVNNCAARESSIRKEHGWEILMMAQKCDSEKTAMRDADIEKLEARISAKDAMYDEMLRNTEKVLSIQKRTKNNVRKTLNAVNK